ncbi:MAG: RHS repeat-associated core domain-containing protein [Fimbriimonadaceae bacterium]|nr:MAG: RHS repeat-associated core domain-containing protein [Fimbriimonadaceae bacterium]
MIATVTKNSGGTTWNIGDERNYDVWGGMRQGNATGGPKGRYVANLGHVQDDESGLVYMRARYYEPGSGRFVSQDLKRSGVNYYVYASNNPVDRLDFDGCSDEEAHQIGQSLIQNALPTFFSHDSRGSQLPPSCQDRGYCGCPQM